MTSSIKTLKRAQIKNILKTLQEILICISILGTTGLNNFESLLRVSLVVYSFGLHYTHQYIHLLYTLIVRTTVRTNLLSSLLLQVGFCGKQVCKPMDCSLPASSVHGIFQTKILKWIPIPFSRGSSQPRFPALQTDSLPSEPPGKPK